MADNYTCDQCGEEFESERGLHIHVGQVHDQEIEKNQEENNTEDVEVIGQEHTEDDGGDFPLDAKNIEIPVELALLSVFILGIAAGLSSGLLLAGSGFSLQGMPSGDNMNPSPDDTGGGSDGPPSTVDISKIEKTGEPVLGESDAPVTMVLYEDFQCPFCQRFENGAYQQIENDYVNNGKVKVIWKDFPLSIHPQAEATASVMECVYRQDESVFWDLKSKIFDSHSTLYPRSGGQYTTTEDEVQETIIGWASDNGVSSDSIRTCLENENPLQEVQSDLQEGQSFDTVIETPRGNRDFVSGTPSAVIYAEGEEQGEPVVGAQPFSVYQSIIRNKLEQ